MDASTAMKAVGFLFLLAVPGSLIFLAFWMWLAPKILKLMMKWLQREFDGTPRK